MAGRNVWRRAARATAHGAAAALLLAATLAMFGALLGLPLNLGSGSVLRVFVAGFAAGLVVFTMLHRFLLLYVVGHELTHWFAAKLFRRRTGALRVGRDGGSVAVERPNIWIVLAPYFVPVYTLILMGLYGVLVFAVPEWTARPLVAKSFTLGYGVTYAFHVVLTVQSLLHGQRDIQQYGPVLSLSLILFCNTAVLLLGLTAATGLWLQTAGLVAERLQWEWQWVTRLLRSLVALMREHLPAATARR